ncbi:hypothetical protein BO78DRAFT_276417, partial [Aspergillus sclerotiicarbonarius CBS 121057]
MNNSGTGKLQVPGFGEFNVTHTPYPDKFAHGLECYGRAHRLTICEVYMLRLMERLTNKPNWEHDVFDERLVAQWYNNFKRQSESEPDCDVDMDLISPRTWEWCILELRDKAIEFQKTGRVLTFNADSGVCKSDALVGMKNELQEAFKPLLDEKSPESKSSNQDLVDPSLFMLFYGHTPVLTEGGQVTMTEGDISYPNNIQIAPPPGYLFDSYRLTTWSGGDKEFDYNWTNQYQWLPCEVEFTGQDSEVRITSYINNLHPKHKRAYAAIEKLISLSLEPWNEVLTKSQSRYPLRIKTYGVGGSGLDGKLWDLNHMLYKHLPPKQCWTSEISNAYWIKVREYLALPDPDQKYRIFHPHPSNPEEPNDLLERMPVGISLDSPDSRMQQVLQLQSLIDIKEKRLRTFHYPEPGISYSYEDWKQGKTSKPINKQRLGFDTEKDHIYQSISLQDEFRERGLQAITRISSIELTPENPSYAGDDDFSVSGLLNEHIVCTSRYYYDVENLTPARISFQQEDDVDERFLDGQANALEKIFGLASTLCPLSGRQSAKEKGLHRKLQTLGSVSTDEGRLLAWSNTLRSKTQPFSLKDKTRPGHQRFISISLVDPHYRICSTRNVPPQQNHWWHEAVQNSMRFLPPELMNQIMKETGNWPMGMDEAQERKKK